MTSQMELWRTEDRTRWFLLPIDRPPPKGTVSVRNLSGTSAQIDANWVGPFEVREDQGRRWAREELGNVLGELRQGIDARLGELRQELQRSERGEITSESLPAIADLLKALPAVIGQSLSGDPQRVATARTAMVQLQKRLQQANIQVDDRVGTFPDRLASLRQKR